LAANHKTHVITQKPIAPSIAIAERLVKICQTAGNLYLVHENWRWQRQIRELKKLLCSNIVGKVFRAKLTMVSGYPVFRNEPTLKELEQFIITDIGTHIIDVARFLFGEAVSLYCQIQKVHPNIKGEDVATIMMKMRENSSTVIIELGYPENYLENDAFPQTFAFIEGEKGSIELTYDYRLKITTKEGTLSRRYPPETYPWADPDYMVVHSSIVPCNKHLLDAVRGEARAETSAEDHLNTIRLTYEAYKSANKNQAINYQ
jgi:predicted dehydrogenase